MAELSLDVTGNFGSVLPGPLISRSKFSENSIGVLMFDTVEFASEGALLCGRFYRPGRQAPFPVVVMTHGTTATMTMALDRYAELFCSAGLAVLLYDHRNFGRSGGEPRQEINPWIQTRGYRDAVNYLLTRSDVDADRIGRPFCNFRKGRQEWDTGASGLPMPFVRSVRFAAR